MGKGQKAEESHLQTSPQPLSYQARGLNALLLVTPPFPRRRGRLGGRGQVARLNLSLIAPLSLREPPLPRILTCP
jgi:hypothetical protein